MEAGTGEEARPFLLVVARRFRCALPLEYVVETMRPPALTVLALVPEPPAYVRGISTTRDSVTVVVDLAQLLGEGQTNASRLVIVRSGSRRVGVLVDAVLGILAYSTSILERLPPLLGAAGRSAVVGMAVRDADLVTVLETSRLVPEQILSAVPEGAAA